MTRREFLTIAGAVGLTAGGCVTGTGRRQLPNIVFIMADDLGWNELGCYGQEKIETPMIDRLAAEGMRFTQYYAGSAVCAPSRCNLMTGLHGGHAYVRSNLEIKNPDSDRFGGQLPLPDGQVTVAEILKSQGYATGCFGKWGLGAHGSEGGPLNQGFDCFYGYNCQRHAHNLYPRYLEDNGQVHVLEGNDRARTGAQYAPQLIADRMLDFVREHRHAPFFLYYPTVIPHLALQVPEPDLEHYRGRWPETPYTGRSYQPHETPKACYAAMITFLDRQVGRLMALLRELGLDDNTIVFFTSDNGTTHLKAQVDYEFFNSVGPLRGLKGSLYEGGIRVPMVARWPGHVPAAAVRDHVAAHYDVPATLAELTGAPLEDTDGISFLPTLLGCAADQESHRYLFWDFAGYGGQIAVRMGRWKGVKQGLRKNPEAPLELYDLAADVAESRNVAAEFPQVAATVERIMVDARTRPATERFQFGRYAEASA